MITEWCSFQVNCDAPGCQAGSVEVKHRDREALVEALRRRNWFVDEREVKCPRCRPAEENLTTPL